MPSRITPTEQLLQQINDNEQNLPQPLDSVIEYTQRELESRRQWAKIYISTRILTPFTSAILTQYTNAITFALYTCLSETQRTPIKDRVRAWDIKFQEYGSLELLQLSDDDDDRLTEYIVMARELVIYQKLQRYCGYYARFHQLVKDTIETRLPECESTVELREFWTGIWEEDGLKDEVKREAEMRETGEGIAYEQLPTMLTLGQVANLTGFEYDKLLLAITNFVQRDTAFHGDLNQYIQNGKGHQLCELVFNDLQDLDAILFANPADEAALDTRNVVKMFKAQYINDNGFPENVGLWGSNEIFMQLYRDALARRAANGEAEEEPAAAVEEKKVEGFYEKLRRFEKLTNELAAYSKL